MQRNGVLDTAPWGNIVAASININIRVSKHLRDLIDRGAAATHKTRATFMLDASAAAAQDALLDQTYFALSPTQMVDFEHIMNKPLSDSRGMADLLASRSPWER